MGIEDLKVGEPNSKELSKIYKELEFNAWLQEVPERQATSPKINQSYKCITTKKDLKKVIKEASKSDTVAIDTETTGLDYIDSELVGISISFNAGEGFYIPIKHNDESIIQLPLEDVINELKPLLESSEKKIIGQNIKFDKNILMKYGLK